MKIHITYSTIFQMYSSGIFVFIGLVPINIIEITKQRIDLLAKFSLFSSKTGNIKMI